MDSQVYYERRGTMVYTEDSRPGKAKFIAECMSIEQAQRIVDLLNELTRRD
jgi:hypothetical protein